MKRRATVDFSEIIIVKDSSIYLFWQQCRDTFVVIKISSFQTVKHLEKSTRLFVFNIAKIRTLFGEMEAANFISFSKLSENVDNKGMPSS